MQYLSKHSRRAVPVFTAVLLAAAQVGAVAPATFAAKAKSKKATPTSTTPATLATVPPPVATVPPAPTRNLTSCVDNYDSSTDYFPDKATVAEAKGFTVTYQKNYKVVSVPSPWRGATTGFTYVLVQCGTPAPKLTGALEKATVIQVPIATAALMSTTEAPAFDLLGQADKVVAVDDPANYSTPSIVARIKSGKIKAVGGGSKANTELLLTLKPSVILTYGTGSASFDGIERLTGVGLTAVVEAGYLEQTPLGRSEWVKVVGALTNREGAAEASFDSWRKDYNALAAKMKTVRTHPVVIAGSMYQGTWYVPGGKSFAAQFIRDAGGNYPWASDSSTGSLALDFETVLDKAYDATVWINAGYLWQSRNDALKEDSRYSKLIAYNANNVWGNDGRINATGGSDYFETAVVRPDLVLADLAAVLHPEIDLGRPLLWYRHIPR
jgi:iron complex transport system substrate-binding protein